MQEPFQGGQRLYMLPIGGTAMASLAGLLHLAGHRVEGVDSHLYPPMSTILEELGLPVRVGFDPAAIPASIDRVVIGNAVGRDNPEVREVLRRGVPYLAQAEAVAHYLLAEGREAIVVAGTHGKTTTSALLAWVLETVQMDPTYLVGGMLSWSQRSFRLGHGPWMVIEGDEYNTAFFDRGPKFLHYRPQLFLLGPVEFDHADIYPTLDAVLTGFRAGTAQVPPHGRVVVNASSQTTLDAVRDATAPLVRVGPEDDHEVRLSDERSGPDGSSACLRWRGEDLTLHVPLVGRHNLHNAAMAFTGAVLAGVAAGDALAALARFPGVKRRLEVVGTVRSITVVDDFAHHPTAVAATVAAARERWPGRRLIIAYEPRSLTAGRTLFHEAYVRAFSGADVVLMAPVYHHDRLQPEDRLDLPRLARDLEGIGLAVCLPARGEDPVNTILPLLESGDVVVACSSGSFEGFCRRLVEQLTR
ncbi:MAG: Mur ligase domain-containing protein [Acidobacteria bacterium]|nr:Mur ligase domain-containing protein [Acidobacteriota bacterium]